MNRITLVLILAAGLAAAEPALATWTAGDGSIASATASPGVAITAGQEVRAGSSSPIRCDLAGCPGSNLILAPGSAATLSVETRQVDGVEQRDLVVDMIAGMTQVDLRDRGGYARLLLRGAVLEVEVKGTLLTGERSAAQEDYVVLVRGLVTVRLKSAVAEALHRQSAVDLEARQGVGGSLTGGLGQVQIASARPQLAASSDNRPSLQAQAEGAGLGAEALAASWDLDLAADILEDLLENTGNASALADLGELAVEEAVVEAIAADLIEDIIVDEVIADEIQQAITGELLLGDFPSPP